MAKPVLLIAKTTLGYAGQRLGLGMQFHVAQEDADRLVASGQADLVSTATESKGSSTTLVKPDPTVETKRP